MQKNHMMKTTLLLGSMLLSTVTFAQFSKGDHLFSGSVGLNSSASKFTGTSTSDISKNTGVSLNLSGSTFSSNLVRNTVGFYVSHYAAKDNLTNPGSRSETSGLNYGISFSRAKLLPVAKSLYLNFPFTVSAGLQHVTSKTGLGPSESRVNGFNTSVGISAGLLYQLNKRWVVTLSLPDIANVGYSNTTNKYYVNGVLQGQGTKTNSIGLNSAIGSRLLSDLSVGFGYIIPRKK
jgi:hypothetical protein